MNHRRCLVALSANTLFFALLIAGCGDSGDDSTATGGVGATSQTGGTSPIGGGGSAAGGTGGGGAQPATGGGGPLQASCDNVLACGGDVVGVWTVAGACLALGGQLGLSTMGIGCISGTVTGSTLNVSGTLTVNADGSLDDNLTWTGEVLFDLAPECQEVSGTYVLCDRLQISLGGLGYVEGLNYDTVTCVPPDPNAPPPPPTTGCDCTAVINQPGGAVAAGAYMLEGNVIKTSNGAEYSYCVDGNTLTLTPTKFAQDTSTTNTGTIVLQR